ncbi:helix-loop-helix DNA-binding domain-containing protein [Zychaea mexicana]|uniref:helix-loop-helix DNA-binding domain-containing protein n=1 Tax=Zychaea mexicana TaxID=64656 RepID=UPI0022FED43A|nr:helix-loop-helix DNA-binding domain-containing protein [Zychaea mexicana]KAI9494533.1 helix-loop-helix DNA-binding domain-containing protein [Zychaea mexicana]
MSMYSPTQQDFNEQFSQTGLASMGGTPHTTVGAVPVRNQQQRHSGVFNPSASNSYQLHHHHQHQRQNSFGAAASIAVSPPNNVAAAAAAAAAAAGGRPISFADPNAQNWFGTSLDSNGSSFGQSPIFGGRDLIVSPSTSTGHLDGSTTGGGYPGGAGGGEDDELQQRNLQEMFEKRRRRRESHNAVERRRRDNINERIHELSTLLPEHLLESAPTTSNVMSVSSGQGGGGASNMKAINKGTILKLSVDHIKELKDTLTQYKDRVAELERSIESAKQNDSAKVKAEDGSHSTTASRARHERIGSLQFQQQFGKLHIEDSKQV